MALVPDQKFSTFIDGGDLEVNDIIVGLRDGLNTRFTFTGEIPIGVVVPIANGGTGATTAGTARINLGLGTIATQDADDVAITGGTAELDSLTLASPLAISSGGTAVTSVTTSPTASHFAGWDANVNFSSNAFIPGFTTTVTAAGTTVLTVASDQIQEFTGTTTQTVTMPVVSTLSAGHPYTVINNSSGVVTVQSSGGNTIQALAANTVLFLTCVLTSGTTAASWNSSYVFENGAGVLSITGTADQVIASSSTGNITLSLPQSIATSSTPTFNGMLSTADIIVQNGNAFVANSGTGGFGSLSIFSPNNAGNFGNSLSSVSTTAGRSWLLPDASGTIALEGEIPPNNLIVSTVSQDSPVSMASATPTTVTSLLLGAGNWAIGGNGYAKATGFVQALVVGISQTNNGYEGDAAGQDPAWPNTTINGLYVDGTIWTSLSTGTGYFTFSVPTTVYLVLQYNCNGAAALGWGQLWAYNY